MARGLVSKFQPCLPKEAEDRLLAERLLDVEGTIRFIGGVTVNGIKVREGLRLIDAELRSPPEVLAPLHVPPSLAHQPRHPIHLVETEEALQRACEKLAMEPAIGLDVETTLDFGVVCLIQLASSAETFIVDAIAVRDLNILGQLLRSPTVLKIIHHALFEQHMLGKLGFEIAPVFDTLVVSRRKHGPDVLGGHSLAVVLERELGVLLDKREQTSDWSHRPLSADQLSYAALDAEVLVALWRSMTDSKETSP